MKIIASFKAFAEGKKNIFQTPWAAIEKKGSDLTGTGQTSLAGKKQKTSWS